MGDRQMRSERWGSAKVDQLRTTTAELRTPQRLTMVTSDEWFALDTRRGRIWGSRGREFKSRQPDSIWPSETHFVHQR
jgi:hypothetical protein